MTPEQQLAIEWECTKLIHRYALLNDRARWQEVASLYTHDGLMTRPTAPDQAIVGRGAILESFLARPPRTTRHVCTNVVVTVESETEASAESVILLFTGPASTGLDLPTRDPPGPLVGTYHDRFQLTSTGWRFTERRGALSFRPSP